MHSGSAATPREYDGCDAGVVLFVARRVPLTTMATGVTSAPGAPVRAGNLRVKTAPCYPGSMAVLRTVPGARLGVVAGSSPVSGAVAVLTSLRLPQLLLLLRRWLPLW